MNTFVFCFCELLSHFCDKSGVFWLTVYLCLPNEVGKKEREKEREGDRKKKRVKERVTERE